MAKGWLFKLSLMGFIVILLALLFIFVYPLQKTERYFFSNSSSDLPKDAGEVFSSNREMFLRDVYQDAIDAAKAAGQTDREAKQSAEAARAAAKAVFERKNNVLDF